VRDAEATLHAAKKQMAHLRNHREGLQAAIQALRSVGASAPAP
jgi:hypothetical protein